MFVLSQCDLCVLTWLLCTTRMASCRELATRPSQASVSLLRKIMKEGRRAILSSRVIGLVLILCLVHTLRKDKQDYSFTSEYFGLCFSHSSSVKEVNWDTRHCTKWRTHVHVTISMRVKRASATTAYYANSTSTFRPVIQLLHDVELNPGPANCSSGDKSEKSNGNVKIAHLNVRSLKCR